MQCHALAHRSASVSGRQLRVGAAIQVPARLYLSANAAASVTPTSVGGPGLHSAAPTTSHSSRLAPCCASTSSNAQGSAEQIKVSQAVGSGLGGPFNEHIEIKIEHGLCKLCAAGTAFTVASSNCNALRP